MKKLLYFLPLLSLLILQNCKTPAKSTNTKEEVVEVEEPEGTIPKPALSFAQGDKLMPLLEQAKRENKLLFVDFYATWCIPCKMMDEEVFTDPELANFMNDKFINVKVNGEKGNGVNLITIFNVGVYPTLLFLDAEGNVLVRKDGMAYQRELRKMAEKALAAR